MTSEVIDISLVIKQGNYNRSINNCMDYLKKRGITYEIVQNEASATGLYVCLVDIDTMYYDYYVHMQYVALEFMNRKCNKYVFEKICVYAELDTEFYVGDFKTCNRFYRRSSGFVGPEYVEKDIFPGCTVNKLNEMPLHVPGDGELHRYYNYFNNL